jgi:hypothetical protein
MSWARRGWLPPTARTATRTAAARAPAGRRGRARSGSGTLSLNGGASVSLSRSCLLRRNLSQRGERAGRRPATRGHMPAVSVRASFCYRAAARWGKMRPAPARAPT